MGESERHIPKPIIEKYSEISWKHMKSMRNMLIHEYFGIDLEIIWETVTWDLPALRIRLELFKESML